MVDRRYRLWGFHRQHQSCHEQLFTDEGYFRTHQFFANESSESFNSASETFTEKWCQLWTRIAVE
jgi:hypothetical protein